MGERIHTNYRLVMRDREMLGTLVTRDGRIADIQPGVSACGEDGRGDYLLPGLIELHTDTLEGCAMPRIGVQWPLALAVVQQDRMLVSSGITTAYNALAVREIPETQPIAGRIRALRCALQEAFEEHRLRADHRLHLRCETTCAGAAEVVREHAKRGDIVSLMDHRPGQRQFSSRAKLNEYYSSKYELTEDQVERVLADNLTDEDQIDRNRKRIADAARLAGAVIASHDDSTVSHVEEAIADGATISEFPTTTEAAKTAASRGLRILMGAPNVVLGRSHSGNLSTEAVAKNGRLHILSSDYAPHSLLPALFRLKESLDIPLHQAALFSTLNPATAVGLDSEIGDISIGKRADFITCHYDGVVPLITSVVIAGDRAA